MKERGQAFLALLMVLLVAGVGAIFTFLPQASGHLKEEERTRKIMVAAREALIGYAASSATRPGQLPCPDMNNDGLAEAPDASGCPSGNIGRLPWRTLGLEDLRDGAAERLWYAPSTVFTQAVTNVCCFDNDTRGTLTVYQDSTANTITNEAVALIFAPSLTIFGQNRSAANANNPVHYLDVTSGVSNASADGLFISAQASSSFNDRPLVITTAHLWTVVEMRVAREMLALLKEYRDNSVCNCYPWAASDFDDDSQSGDRNGMVPIETALPEDWGSGSIPTVPSWMVGSDEWGKQFFYTVAGDETEDHTGGTLTLGGVSRDLVIITPGPAGAIVREIPRDTSRNLNDYIDAVPAPPALTLRKTAITARILTGPHSIRMPAIVSTPAPEHRVYAD